MRRKLSTEESLRRYIEGRKLWNAFDPIGVADAVDDEYEFYITPSLRLVSEGKGVEEVEAYVQWVVHDRMGFDRTEEGDEANHAFAKKFVEWYLASWPGTEV
ncbi:MAG TPA: hypothetical protein VHL34_21740 [Rhizomicrobium sp.]|jgi:hypothetical protein|nr:hypothetical protein [Rhizomicrobium sp.]